MRLVLFQHKLAKSCWILKPITSSRLFISAASPTVASLLKQSRYGHRLVTQIMLSLLDHTFTMLVDMNLLRYAFLYIYIFINTPSIRNHLYRDY